MKLSLDLQPKQQQFFDLCEKSKASTLGFGGSRGGAKSGACRRVMLIRRLRYDGTWGIIVRRVYDDVKRNHIDKFFGDWPMFEKFYSKTNHEITFPNQSKIIFGYAETLDEVKRKFHGPEYMDIFVDQAEQFTEEELHQMKLACRWPGQPDFRCKLGLFFNPGGVGIAYLKRVFHDRLYHENERPEDFEFIQAYSWDNFEWVRDAAESEGISPEEFYSWDGAVGGERFNYVITKSQYGKELNALPQNLRLGMLLGSFDRFSGQYFGEVWDRDKAVLSQRQIQRLMKPWWSRWIAIDWGYSHYSAVYWFAKGTVNPDEFNSLMDEVLGKKARDYRVETPQDLVLTYREFVERSVGEADLAARILHNTPREEREEVRRIFLSPDAFAKRGSANTIAEQIGDVLVGGGLPRPHPADNDRVGGWRLMHGLLKRNYELGGLNIGAEQGLIV